MSKVTLNMQIRDLILALTRKRGPDKSICPSEVARAHGGANWRTRMPAVRHVARELIEENLIIATQGGSPVDLATVKGPIRLQRIADD